MNLNKLEATSDNDVGTLKKTCLLSYFSGNRLCVCNIVSELFILLSLLSYVLRCITLLISCTSSLTVSSSVLICLICFIFIPLIFYLHKNSKLILHIFFYYIFFQLCGIDLTCFTFHIHVFGIHFIRRKHFYFL